MDLNRRKLLKTAAMSGLLRGTASLFAPSRLLALAPSSDSYKALVCIALDGGCDGNNVLVPLDTQRYALYSSARGQLALSASSLHGISDGAGGAYGLHPALTKVASYYTGGQVAIVANAGPLSKPMTKAEVVALGSDLPTDLLNHEKQRYEWGTSKTVTGSSLTISPGWGGRIADAVSSLNTGTFPTVTCLVPGMSEQVFCYGNSTYPAVVTPGMAGTFPTDAAASLQLLSRLSSGSAMVGAAANTLGDSLQQSSQISGILSSAPTFSTVFPSSDLGVQLKQVLQMIAARSSLGMQRQIFQCALQGFDNHQDQLFVQGSALADLDACLAAFMAGLLELGLSEKVTTFTTSDFARTLVSNSTAGSDHGWGNHQIIIGAAVKGGRFYGTYPSLDVNGPDEMGQGQGRWIPTTSVDQYGATLARWFGVPTSSLTTMFPNLGNFTSSLSFL